MSGNSGRNTPRSGKKRRTKRRKKWIFSRIPTREKIKIIYGEFSRNSRVFWRLCEKISRNFSLERDGCSCTPNNPWRDGCSCTPNNPWREGCGEGPLPQQTSGVKFFSSSKIFWGKNFFFLNKNGNRESKRATESFFSQRCENVLCHRTFLVGLGLEGLENNFSTR